MKSATAILCAAFAYLAMRYLTGCTTTENADGTRTTRYDPEAAERIAKLGTGLYNTYRSTPVPYYPPQQPMVNPYNGQVFYPCR